MTSEYITNTNEPGNENSSPLVDVASLLNLPSLSEKDKRTILQAFEQLQQPKVVLISIEEHEKKKELEKKKEEIKQKQDEYDKWLKILKQNSEEIKKKLIKQWMNLLQMLIKKDMI
ncbi:DNA repair protein RecN [Reticulomyxa filosa]|uniref:DNA repair protein RecN n=1 Tax=Reticulomyxa filosa TaxID=46433 RepID=X6M5D0_RETFI|nr:DNA repair protein RecN [Reticulomyxa filosa]|eukprot:ETO08831.1 DNA repair protein RecN [Reticulomyxa filosa]